MVAKLDWRAVLAKHESPEPLVIEPMNAKMAFAIESAAKVFVEQLRAQHGAGAMIPTSTLESAAEALVAAAAADDVERQTATSLGVRVAEALEGREKLKVDERGLDRRMHLACTPTFSQHLAASTRPN